MTQSGQSEEPSQRQAREGIVLPSDGGEPLLPGMLGNQAGPQNGSPQGRQGGSHTAQGGPHAGQQPGPQTPASAPPGGQSWGTPWGPDRQETAPPAPGQGWDSPPAQSWGTPGPYQQPATDPWGAGSQPLPQEGAPSASYGGPAQPMPGASPHDGYAPAGHQPTSGSPLPPANPYPGTAGGSDAYGAAGSGAAMPSAQPMGQGAQPSAGYGAPAAFGAPLPPADEGATQLIPPVTGGVPGSEGATQYLPPVPAAPADEGATQFLPPVAPGALPPQAGGHPSGEATQFLGRPDRGGAGPLPPAADPDAQATQYIPPVGDHRQPPAEFDNLFRGGPGGEAPAGSTQQLPRFEQPPQQQPAYGGPQSSYFPPGRDDDGGGRGGHGGRTKSRVPLIAAVGIGIVVLGVGAGALLGGGGGGDGKDNNQPVSATAPAGDGSASPSADPAKQQAVALDKLLADSGNSRASVINAVADVKSCRNLGGAASDLRAAAKQRGELVTRLAGLSVDRLPDHADLTTALTKAWQASASADNHYAAWADQVGGRKGCHKGQARSTGQTAAGNVASGTASQQKLRASRLWNAIAKSYGLTQRGPTQL